LSGQDGDKLSAANVKQRLDQELVGNVSLRVLPTERPEVWEVQGRGELQLAVLVEQMRREGFELTVGKPQVVTRMVDGQVHEPMERVSIDVPEEYLGVVTQLFALRKGRTEALVNHGTGWVRMDVVVPARGLIGFRTEFLTETRGTRSGGGVGVGEKLTAEQHARLASELAELEGPKRQEIVDAIRTARGHGDLSENFEYHAAKNEQALLERRIAILRDRLDRG